MNDTKHRDNTKKTTGRYSEILLDMLGIGYQSLGSSAAIVSAMLLAVNYMALSFSRLAIMENVATMFVAASSSIICTASLILAAGIVLHEGMQAIA
jgi:mevalonate kinase